MAMNTDAGKRQSDANGARAPRSVRWAAGTNVAFAVILAVVLVAVLQWGVYTRGSNVTADLTSSGVNSLSEGTERLLGSLDEEVTIVSTYFESDIESPTQARFRNAVRDLIDLYRISNPSRIIAKSINPLQDHQQRKELFQHLQAIPKFKEQTDRYQAVIDSFRETVAPRLADLLAQEQASLSALTGSFGQGGNAKVLQAVNVFIADCQSWLADVQENVQATMDSEMPDYAGAATALRTLYRKLSGAADAVGSFAREQAAAMPDVSDDVLGHVNQLAEDFKPVVELVKAEEKKARDLPQLELDKIVRQFSPTGNAIFVYTDGDARIIPFAETWPPAAEGAAPAGDDFASREFRGEEKISSAILQLTQEKKPAVVFVRYGGAPLFFGGFQPGAPRPPYARMRQHLEDLNFTVQEWDLATTTTPPVIEPEPERVVYVVLRPSPPPPSMRGQPPQPPFGDQHRQAVLDAIGEDGRALFIAGWSAGQFGLFPTPYEYDDYLKETWGIDVLSDVLVIQAIPVGPDEFRLARGFQNMTRTIAGANVIVKGLGRRRSSFPLVAPLKTGDELPEGVEVETLLWCPAHDGLWGVKDIHQRLQEQQGTRHVARKADDLRGPFTLAVSATRSDAKIVVVGSLIFAIDDVAFATVPVFTGQGIGLVSLNPSNVTLFVNSLHWLNDNTQWMNLGRPIETQVIDIEEGPALTFVRVLVYGVWPAVALLCGGVVWFVRRR